MPNLLRASAAAALLLCAGAGRAQDAWQACTALADPQQRLACFDRWAGSQRPPAPAPSPAGAAPAPAPAPSAATAGVPPPSPPAAAEPATPPAPAATPAAAAAPRPLGLRLTRRDGCRDPSFSDISRYWELEPGADCGDFGLRGYRPISLGLVAADTVNQLPTSGNPANTATVPQPYRTNELRLQLSVRTKIAQGLFLDDDRRRDSLWLAYSQQSYWQLFTAGLSRPFRSTDHEPEVIYIAPVQSAQPGRWRLRYAGLSINHQSNGQSLPLSRSWNRGALLLGAEYGDLQLHARVWRRLPEGGDDDNPAIGSFIGRGELAATWQADAANRFAVTARHSLKRHARGSLRLEWFRSLGDQSDGMPSGLQMHTQLFAGYGDSLLDYNRKRVMFSVGLSLVDW